MGEKKKEVNKKEKSGVKWASVNHNIDQYVCNAFLYIFHLIKIKLIDITSVAVES